MDFFILWENDLYTISTPANPHLAYSEGLHLIVSPKQEISRAWDDPLLSASTFKLAAEACRITEDIGLAPWFNIQANGNWGLLPGATTSFHVHIFGRNKTASWGRPLILPEAPGSYNNSPMPKIDRELLSQALKKQL